MKARKSPIDPRKKYSVKDDPTNPGMRNKGLKPLSKGYVVDLVSTTGTARERAHIHKDGKSGTRHVFYTDASGNFQHDERDLPYGQVRKIKQQNKLR